MAYVCYVCVCVRCSLMTPAQAPSVAVRPHMMGRCGGYMVMAGSTLYHKENKLMIDYASPLTDAICDVGSPYNVPQNTRAYDK